MRSEKASGVSGESRRRAGNNIDLTKDAGADAAGDAPRCTRRRYMNRKEKCEPGNVRRGPPVRQDHRRQQDDNLVHCPRLGLPRARSIRVWFHTSRRRSWIALLIAGELPEQFLSAPPMSRGGCARRRTRQAPAFHLQRPDVFTQEAALHNASAQGISLGIGAALGASFFVALQYSPSSRSWHPRGMSENRRPFP